jgi:isopenicillin N synthase-like dioxygenase
MSTLDLPVVDLRDATGPGRAAFVAALGAALQATGFVAVTGHGVAPDLLEASYAAGSAFFALPDAEKRRWERPELGRQRGYTGFGIERAKDRAVADLKEFWQLGRPVEADDAGVPANVVPDAPEGFADRMDALFAAMDGVAAVMLRAIAEHLGLPADALSDAVAQGNSVLRVIHYPPVGPDAPEGAVRAAAHEDINLLTLLPASTQPGLELLDREGVWRALVTPPDVLICDTGDLMAHLTGGLLPATTHRVVNPPGTNFEPRMSMPFFCHPRPDFVITPIRGDGAPITAGAFLRQRLIDNGVLTS